jgi:colicin import membrane protein
MPERAAKSRPHPSLSRRQNKDWRSLALAIAIHSLLVLMLVLGLDWKTDKQGPLQVELIMAGDSQFSPPPAPKAESTMASPAPKPEPKPEPIPEPKPEPKPEPEVPPPPPPAPPEPQVTPKIEEDPEIALEQERKRKLEQERIERELAEKKAKEEARKEQERLKRERELAEKKEKEKIEKERKEFERKLKEEVDKKLAAEQKIKEEAERKAKEEAEKKAKAEAEKKAKEEAEKKAKAEAAKKAAADKALRDAFRNDALGTAGAPGGTADRAQAGGNADTGYAAKLLACIKGGVSFPTPPRASATNPTVKYRVQVKSDGTVFSIKILDSSGNQGFDRAVEAGIGRCSPLPKPPSGNFPPMLDVNYQMYE